MATFVLATSSPLSAGGHFSWSFYGDSQASRCVDYAIYTFGVPAGDPCRTHRSRPLEVVTEKWHGISE